MSVATENALATIASILDQPEATKATDKPAAPKNTVGTVIPFDQADGYAKVGPGPISAIRFRWAARRAEDGYYVDETVGPTSIAVSSGPMTAEAAIKLVDARAREAIERFEALKSEMTGKGQSVSTGSGGK